ncbi:PilZ domain-containing protein [Humidesulfovibrio idahonensis]
MRATDYSSVDLDDALTRPVLVLTKHPEDYRQTLQASGLTPVFAADMRELGQRLQDQAVSGFVLEFDAVWQTRGLQREHLFQLAEAFPLLRVHRAHANDALEFMDKPQDFVSQVLRFFPRRARLAPRAPVVLQALLANANDPGFNAASQATILDVSTNGGLVLGAESFSKGDLLNLRIGGLSDPAPITAGVCWRGKHGQQGRSRHCAGLRFMGLTPGQAEEIETRLLAGA